MFTKEELKFAAVAVGVMAVGCVLAGVVTFFLG
jgi:hypothetical protein